MKGLIFICLMATTVLNAQSDGMPVELSLRECETVLGIVKRDTTTIGIGTISLAEGMAALSTGDDVVFFTSIGILSKVFVADTIKSLAFGPGAGEGAALQFLLGSPVTWRNEVYFKTGSNPQRNSLLLNIEFLNSNIKYISLGLYERERFTNVDQLAFVSSIKDGYVKITSLQALKPNKEYLAVIFTQKED